MNRLDFVKLLNAGGLPPQMKMIISLAMNAVDEKKFQAGLQEAQRLMLILRTGDESAMRNEFAAAGLPPEILSVLMPPGPNAK